MTKHLIASGALASLLMSGTALAQEMEPAIPDSGEAVQEQPMDNGGVPASPDTPDPEGPAGPQEQPDAIDGPLDDMEQQDPVTNGTDDQVGEDPMADDPMADDPLADDPAQMDAAPGAETQATESFLTGQQEGQFMASNIMNVEVYGATDEHIGNVDDIIIDSDGSVVGVVVGVGGFLGIGESDVAIPVNALEIVPVGAPEAQQTDTGWGWWGNDEIEFIRVNATQEELEAAPEFTRTDATW